MHDALRRCAGDRPYDSFAVIAAEIVTVCSASIRSRPFVDGIIIRTSDAEGDVLSLDALRDSGFQQVSDSCQAWRVGDDSDGTLSWCFLSRQ